jgi:tRNA 2-thiouridine synthesizing protein A
MWRGPGAAVKTRGIATDEAHSGTEVSPMSAEPTVIDLRGLKCPLPALRTRKALSRLAPGATLIVECTDPLAEIDIPNLVRETGDTLEATARQADVLVFAIRKQGG